MIQPLAPTHGAALAALETRAQSGAGLRFLEEALLDADAVVLGYWEAQALIGYALLARLPFEAELQAIGVLQEHRGQGVGRALLQGVIVKAREWQSERVLLEVREHNTAAIGLYVQAGFSVDGRRRGYYPAASAAGREDALLMSWTL
ncbi:GNAT family N-acetyltransferase [Vreelandella sp. EE22]